jgi:probable F420-dependent oxidoreductase
MEPETVAIGRVGIRSREIAEGEIGEAVQASRELEDLGFGAIWLNAHAVLERGEELARATDRIVFASSVASIWSYRPRDLADAFGRLDDGRPGRFLLGIGVSHAPIVAQTAPGQVYGKPVASMNAWLDEMDCLPGGVPVSKRIVAAIWPRMLGVAAKRSLGSHPYLVPVGHSRAARELLGPDPLLAPGHVAVVETNPDRARQIGRTHINNPYLRLPNYARNWLRHGLRPTDLEDGGSDRLVDELVAWGSPEAVVEKIGGHFAGGASHVALQVIGEETGGFPHRQWCTLAAVFATTGADSGSGRG